MNVKGPQTGHILPIDRQELAKPENSLANFCNQNPGKVIAGVSLAAISIGGIMLFNSNSSDSSKKLGGGNQSGSNNNDPVTQHSVSRRLLAEPDLGVTEQMQNCSSLAKKAGNVTVDKYFGFCESVVDVKNQASQNLPQTQQLSQGCSERNPELSQLVADQKTQNCVGLGAQGNLTCPVLFEANIVDNTNVTFKMQNGPELFIVPTDRASTVYNLTELNSSIALGPLVVIDPSSDQYLGTISGSGVFTATNNKQTPFPFTVNVTDGQVTSIAYTDKKCDPNEIVISGQGILITKFDTTGASPAPAPSSSPTGNSSTGNVTDGNVSIPVIPGNGTDGNVSIPVIPGNVSIPVIPGNGTIPIIPVNGTVNATVDGFVNATINGTVDGFVNGTIDGIDVNEYVNGTVNGTINGTVNGIVNGTVNGTINGTVNGTVNGIDVNVTTPIVSPVFMSEIITGSNGIGFLPIPNSKGKSIENVSCQNNTILEASNFGDPNANLTLFVKMEEGVDKDQCTVVLGDQTIVFEVSRELSDTSPTPAPAPAPAPTNGSQASITVGGLREDGYHSLSKSVSLTGLLSVDSEHNLGGVNVKVSNVAQDGTRYLVNNTDNQPLFKVDADGSVHRLLPEGTFEEKTNYEYKNGQLNVTTDISLAEYSEDTLLRDISAPSLGNVDTSALTKPYKQIFPTTRDAVMAKTSATEILKGKNVTKNINSQNTTVSFEVSGTDIKLTFDSSDYGTNVNEVNVSIVDGYIKIETGGIKFKPKFESKKYNLTVIDLVEKNGTATIYGDGSTPLSVSYLSAVDIERFNEYVETHNLFFSDQIKHIETHAATRRLLSNELNRLNRSMNEFNQTLVPQEQGLLGSLKGAVNGLLEYIPLFSSKSEGAHSQRRQLLDDADSTQQIVNETIRSMELAIGQDGVPTDQKRNTVHVIEYMSALSLLSMALGVVKRLKDPAFFINGDQGRCKQFLNIGRDLLDLIPKLTLYVSTVYAFTDNWKNRESNLDPTQINLFSGNAWANTTTVNALFSGTILLTAMSEILYQNSHEYKQSSWPDVKDKLKNKTVSDAIDDVLNGKGYRKFAKALREIAKSSFFESDETKDLIIRQGYSNNTKMMAKLFSLKKYKDGFDYFKVKRDDKRELPKSGQTFGNYISLNEVEGVEELGLGGIELDLVGVEAPLNHRDPKSINVYFNINNGQQVKIGLFGEDGKFTFDNEGLKELAQDENASEYLRGLVDLCELLEDDIVAEEEKYCSMLRCGSSKPKDDGISQIFSSEQLNTLGGKAFDQAKTVGKAPAPARLALEHKQLMAEPKKEVETSTVQEITNIQHFQQESIKNTTKILVYTGNVSDELSDQIEQGQFSPVHFGPNVDLAKLELFLSSGKSSRWSYWLCNSNRNMTINTCDFLLQMIHAACKSGK